MEDVAFKRERVHEALVASGLRSPSQGRRRRA
jgi:hypothetical protein